MFPKKYRIKRTDFKRIFKTGKSMHTNYFVLIHLKNPQIKSPQVAVIASKKVGKAVKRNKAKRIVREIIKLELQDITPGTQIIVICKPTITSIKFQDLQSELTLTLKKADLYKNVKRGIQKMET